MWYILDFHTPHTPTSREGGDNVKSSGDIGCLGLLAVGLMVYVTGGAILAHPIGWVLIGLAVLGTLAAGAADQQVVQQTPQETLATENGFAWGCALILGLGLLALFLL